jgi:hypothetical protein
MTILAIKPFFQKTYSAFDLDDIVEDFDAKLNADTTIPVDEDGFNEGVFEVIINWRKE